ncbi:hypothetical protein VYU27_002147 [Nannochloropsis oceanica]
MMDMHTDQILTSRTPPPINEVRREPTFYLRALVLLMASCLTIGSYYVYDTPSSLYAQIQEHFLFYNKDATAQASTFELYFNLLYSVYSIPNILLPFLGGHLVDTVGMRACIVVFSLLVLTGQVITALGVTIQSMTIMLVGRLIFGLGGECLVVGQSAFISAWFHSREVAFALGFTLSVSRLGSVLNDWGSPYIAQKIGVVAAFWFGALLCLGSTCTAFLLACVDKSHRSRGVLDDLEDTQISLATARTDTPAGAGTGRSSYSSSSPLPSAEEQMHLAAPWAAKGSYFETPHPSFYGPPPALRPAGASGGGAGGGGGGEGPATMNTLVHGSQVHHEALQAKLDRLAQLDAVVDSINEDHLWHLMGFDTMFWLLACVCTLSYGAIMPFNNMAQVYLLKNYLPIHEEIPKGVDCSFRPVLPEWEDYCAEVNKVRRTAGSLQSVPFMVAGILTPLVGILIDRCGHRTLYILLGPLLLLATHFVFLVGGTSPLVPLVGLGLAYSIVAAVVWPSVPLTVHASESSKRCGTAFGILTVFQNLSMALFPMAIAALLQLTNGYVTTEYFFIVVSVAGIVAAVCLMVEDEKHGAVLRKYVVDGEETNPYHPVHPFHHGHGPHFRAWGTGRTHEEGEEGRDGEGERRPLTGFGVRDAGSRKEYSAISV